jgi:hypothetical protein
MGGTKQRTEKASFFCSLNWIHRIPFEREPNVSRSSLDFSVSRSTARERA